MTEERQQMAARIKEIAEAYGQAMYDAGMNANSDFYMRRHESDLQRDEANANLAEALAGVEATEGQDAARWRWLRNAVQNGPLTIAMSDSWSLQPWSGDDPDGRVDHAIAAGVAGEAL